MSTRRPLVEVPGIKRLAAALEDSAEGLADLTAANAAAAKIVEEYAVGMCPISETGSLLASIRSSGTKIAGYVRAGRKSTPYAQPVHWGWRERGFPEQRFLSQAAWDRENRWGAEYERALETIVDKHLTGKKF